MQSARSRSQRLARGCALGVFVGVLSASVDAETLEIPSPSGQTGFGWLVKALPNGNIVINDPGAGPAGSGAVHLYRPDGTRISTLTGSNSDAYVGNDPVIVLPDGNFLVASYAWNNGGAMHAGAVTWVSATDGLDGEISAANSIVGTAQDDGVGSFVYVLANGNYVVASPSWHNVGAATLGRRDGSTHGEVSAANSLVGSSPLDSVGTSVVALANGNYLVLTPYWNNAGAERAGAVTWGDGEAGIAGVVSIANSLVGTTAGDELGIGKGYTDHAWALANGNAVVISPNWDNGAAVDAGAVTWIDGAHGLTGEVSAANSLVGTTAGDRIGLGSSYEGLIDLQNGRYAIVSTNWQNGDVARAGAITWGSYDAATTGPVTASNSLVGTHTDDLILAWLTPLANGNAVATAPEWDDGSVADVGAVTWIDGASPPVGAISTAHALVGSTAGDQIGFRVRALTNGNYVVGSPTWHDEGTANVGAATWRDGTVPATGVVSTSNSLHGSGEGDAVSDSGILALDNGNYIVLSDRWYNNGVEAAGAATWGDGTHGIVGAVSPANSIVGDSTLDNIGLEGFALPGGNAVVTSYSWHQVGATTWIDGRTGLAGVVSSSNSLVASAPGDSFGGVTVLDGTGNYIVGAPYWTTGTHFDLGAAVWGNARTGVRGAISSANALVGTNDEDMIGKSITAVGNGNAVIESRRAVTLMRGASGLTGNVSAGDTVDSPGNFGLGAFDYDATRDRLVIGWYGGNSVTLFRPDILFRNGLD